MAALRAKLSALEHLRQPALTEDQGESFTTSLAAYVDRSFLGKRPQGILEERVQPSYRTSARLQEVQRCQEQTVDEGRNTESKTSNAAKQACYSSPLMLRS